MKKPRANSILHDEEWKLCSEDHEQETVLTPFTPFYLTPDQTKNTSKGNEEVKSCQIYRWHDLGNKNLPEHDNTHTPISKSNTFKILNAIRYM